MKSYKKRLRVPLDGIGIALYSKSGTLITNGYRRIVIGKRDAYVEFPIDFINTDIHIPEDQKWRASKQYKDKIYYIEYRTDVDNVKIYHQLRTVKYADYKIGMCYISPVDLYYLSGEVDGKKMFICIIGD